MAYSKEEIIFKIETAGYIFVDEYFGKNNSRKIVVKDTDGYIYYNYIYNIINKTLAKFDKGNPYTLDNISNWLKLNNKSFKILSTKYVGCYEKLKFYCYDCKDEFYVNWSSIKNGCNCAVCRGYQTGKYHSLKYLRPELCEEWSELNKISPLDVTIGSDKDIIWECNICHEKWTEKVYKRVSDNHGCPFCSSHRVSDKNRLSILYPEISEQWHPIKNGNLKPSDFSYGSSHSAWWLCKNCNNEWETKTISERTFGIGGCPFCSGQRVSDKNRLSILYPDVAKEWDYDKNYPLTPEDVSFGSAKTIYWICSVCGHSWKTRNVAKRTTGERGCPRCRASKGNKKISEILRNFGMTEDVDYILEQSFDGCKNKNSLWFDFYLPNYSLCIEYNGEQHYEPVEFFGGKSGFKKQVKSDKIKQKYCNENNIELLIIPYWEFNDIETILIKELNL